MPHFDVEFFDGKTLTVDTATADQAKAMTRATRRAAVPPDTPRSAPEVKIRRVTQLDDKSTSRRGTSRDKE